MAILSNGKFYGFLCSAKETGQKLTNGVKEYVEDFVSGFAGHGWKIWEYVKGKWMLEIDSIRVRGQFTVFELLIGKIRAIIGAQAITQGCGRIKTIKRSEDGASYLITLEDTDMSFVEHDFIRCQEFTGSQRIYHVEIESVTDGVIYIPVSEFDRDEEGKVLNPPVPGDDIVQFGNSSYDETYVGRHSAIYMHADESGQPAIDVLDGIYTKEWSDCLKVRVGGDIPDSGGLKGFYCENGMIKCVDKNKHTTYCLHPDGTAELGDGSAIFRPDKSGCIADGAIKWEWSETKKKYVCTMGDVLLSWDNLDDETKENLKGEPGSIEELPGWLKGWNGYATELGDEYIVTPTMFSGTKSADGKLTGIAQGKECITIDGVKRTGIFALVDNKVVFELDPVSKKYLFRGKVETQSSGKKITIDPDTNSIAMYDSNGVSVFYLKFIEENGKSVPQMSLRGNYRADGKEPFLALTPNSIAMTDYTNYESGTLKTAFILYENGIWFDREGYGFGFSVDSKKSNVSMGGGIRQCYLTRWNPGYLPNESQAYSGNIYINSDGILRLKP